MLGIKNIANGTVFPHLEGKAVRTLFEIELRAKFDSIQKELESEGRLVVNLLSTPNAEGYDYEYLSIDKETLPLVSRTSFSNPALMLDLGKSFEAQWPNALHGKIEHPYQLKEMPYWPIVNPRYGLEVIDQKGRHPAFT